jgi:hypothetical protein
MKTRVAPRHLARWIGACVALLVIVVVAGFSVYAATGLMGLAIYTGGPPAMECGGVSPEVCDEALSERLTDLESHGINVEAVTRFKFRSYGGTCGDSDITYAAWTFGPVTGVTYGLYRPFC